MNNLMKTVSAACLVGLAGTTSAQLLNPSFETPGPGPGPFLNWQGFGNIEADIDELVLDGIASAKMFGAFDGNFNVGVLFQNVDGVDAGDEWEATINVGHVTGDDLQPGARAFLALVFVDPDNGGGNVVDFQTDVLEPGDPLDVFTEVSVSAIAPFDVSEAQILLGFVQEGPAMPGDPQASGAAHFDVASLERVSTNNDIPFYGGGFEEVPPFQRTYYGFRDFGNSIPNLQRLDMASAGTLPPFEGEFVASIFGQFNGDINGNDSGFFQDRPAAEGEMWTASAQVGHASTDAIGVGNSAALSLQFLDAAGNVLDDIAGPVIDSSAATDTWMPAEMSGMAPAGTARARLTFVYSQAPAADGMAGNEPGGSVRVDAVDLAIASAPTRLCADQNGDGMVNGIDFGAWLNNFNAMNPLADVNQDGMVNGIDFGAWLNAFNAGAAGPLCP